jgi:hypothetical protein
MRALATLVLVAACATTAGVSASERVRGCWVSRDDAGGAVTMRWLPDPTQPGVLRGDKLGYGPGGATHNETYRLEPRGDTSALCQVLEEGERCWVVASGEGGSLEGGRAFIDVHQERLRVSVIGDGPDRVVFEGDRDGCD